VPVQNNDISTPPIDHTACTEPHCLYSTAILRLHLLAIPSVLSLNAFTVQLYLYSPYGQYSLYRASVPLQYSYSSTPPMGHTARIQPQSLYSTAIVLLPLLVIRPLYSNNASIVQLYLYSPYGPYGLYTSSVPVQYSYTSTPPVGHISCTELQCLYITDITLLPPWAIRPVQSLIACTVHLYLYSPYWPYGLYTVSVPV